MPETMRKASWPLIVLSSILASCVSTSSGERNAPREGQTWRVPGLGIEIAGSADIWGENTFAGWGLELVVQYRFQAFP